MCAVEYPRESSSFDLQESQEACKHPIWPEEKGVEVKAETGRMEVRMKKILSIQPDSYHTLHSSWETRVLISADSA